jgi:hypothetical protein
MINLSEERGEGSTLTGRITNPSKKGTRINPYQ